MSLKETEMMRESFCSGTFTERGSPAGRAAVCSMRGENTGPPFRVTGGHRHTQTYTHRLSRMCYTTENL